MLKTVVHVYEGLIDSKYLQNYLKIPLLVLADVVIKVGGINLYVIGPFKIEEPKCLSEPQVGGAPQNDIGGIFGLHLKRYSNHQKRCQSSDSVDDVDVKMGLIYRAHQGYHLITKVR